MAEATVRVAEPRDAMEVVAEQETAEPRDSRKGSVKYRRKPRSPVMGAGPSLRKPWGLDETHEWRDEMKIEQAIYFNKCHFKEYGIKPMFTWCEKCSAAKTCYQEGRGPNFLEPACGEGPMKMTEQPAAVG